MIAITAHLTLDPDDLEERFELASGPGGQNVNKVSTAVRLRFRLDGATGLPWDVQDRLARLAGQRLGQDGWITILAQRYRSQERNREDARARLVALVQAALERPKPRRATRPSLGAKARRLEGKTKRATIKRGRGKITLE
jgi:ribosome-associated protein